LIGHVSRRRRSEIERIGPTTVMMRRQGFWAWVLTTGACLWSFALIVAAVTIRTGGGTLVQENGTWVIIPVAVPAVISVLAWFVLHHRCTRGGNWTGTTASLLTGLLAVFSVVGMASIGMFVLPVAVLLALGVQLTPDGPARLQA
jgi:hypothetical protein